MNDVDPWSGPQTATLELTSSDLGSGKATVESEIAVHRCSSCGCIFSDRYHFDCPECGHEGPPLSQCRACGGALRTEHVRYVALSPSGGTVTKILPGVTCSACGVSGVEHHQLEKLEELASTLDEHLGFLPEIGIYTAGMLEVLADAEVACPGAPEEITKQRNGLSVRIGNPTELFDAALEVLTEQEPGTVFSPTLQVTPGPPYTPAQRRDFHVLLAQIQCDLGAPVICWSASVALSDDPPIDAVLSEQLISWQADTDGQGLALYHDIVADRAPGRFLSTVRLLELVVERWHADRVMAARHDPLVTADEFRELVRGLGRDFGEQLRRVVLSLEPSRSDILQRAWLTLRPGQDFDEHAVCGAIAAFPERYLQRRQGQGVSLPWEEPDFDGCARELSRLISAILG
jgi:hypothetical protein